MFQNLHKSFLSSTQDIILEFLDYLFSKKFETKQIIYAHNLDFEGGLILSSLTKSKKYSYNCFVRNLKIYSIEISFGQSCIEFKCSHKILLGSLEEATKSFNFGEKNIYLNAYGNKEKLKFAGKAFSPIDLSFSNESSLFNQVDFFSIEGFSINACLQNVIKTIEAIRVVKQLSSFFNISTNVVYSAPSLSFKVFLKSFNSYKIPVITSKHEDSLVRPAYFGGRCEVYGNPFFDEHLFYYDFPGMYAQCMLESFAYGEYIFKKSPSDFKTPGFY